MKSDDPRLTAYLLGEMDASARAEFEEAMRQDPTIEAALAELRHLNAVLDRAYAEEAVPSTRRPGARPPVAATAPLSPRARAGRIARLKHEAPSSLGRSKKTTAMAMITALIASFALAGLFVFNQFTEFVEERRFERTGRADVSAVKEEDLPTGKTLATEVAATIAEEKKVDDERFEAVAAAVAEGLEVALQDDSSSTLEADSARTEAEALAALDSALATPPPPQVVAATATRMPSGSRELAFSSAPVAPSSPRGGEEVFALSPFEVKATENQGYYASDTVAATSLVRAPVRPLPEPSREAYATIVSPGFQTVRENPLSTFALEVDTASYSNVRRLLLNGNLPPAGAVRVEEMINYFDYATASPGDAASPLAIELEVGAAPWQPAHQLVRIALRAAEIPWAERPPSNLVFLLDVSGSMQARNKLPLVREGLARLVQRLDERDRIAIVTYAGAERVALASTPVSERARILEAIHGLGVGGSTNGAAGIEQAYAIAREAYLADGNNRVILCTDGDFNVGMTSEAALVDLIARQAASGVFLSVFGFGEGNLRDDLLEAISNRGNGSYGYIDSLEEAHRTFVKGAAGTLLTVAKDVKIQVEFNPAEVRSYRLIGYENRALAAADFNDDRKDAGEVGSGDAVTALYEIVPVGAPAEGGAVDPLRYQTAPTPAPVPVINDRPGELLWLKLRYKQPDAAASERLERVLEVPRELTPWPGTSASFRWAAAVAVFGRELRRDPLGPVSSWELADALARSALDAGGTAEQVEFLSLVDRARRLAGDDPRETGQRAD